METQNSSISLQGIVNKVSSCPYLLAAVAGVAALALFGKKKTVRRRRRAAKKTTPKRRKRK